mmetsp:Transcript_66035/g.175844  ORF Transcript_66035/g.175844 Transcript_66035/m.175844 type:complete len:260 (-) Transcript_66035:681-1460(-)
MGTHAHGPTPYAPVVSLDTPQRRQSGLAQPQVKDASARRSGQSIETHFGGREHYVESTPHRCRGGLHERHHDGYQLARELHQRRDRSLSSSGGSSGLIRLLLLEGLARLCQSGLGACRWRAGRAGHLLLALATHCIQRVRPPDELGLAAQRGRILLSVRAALPQRAAALRLLLRHLLASPELGDRRRARPLGLRGCGRRRRRRRRRGRRRALVLCVLCVPVDRCTLCSGSVCTSGAAIRILARRRRAGQLLGLERILRR